MFTYPSSSTMISGQGRGWSAIAYFRNRSTEHTCYQFCPRRYGMSPDLSSLRELNTEVSHQATISVTLFEEPSSMQRRSTQPIQKKRIHLRANWFHQVTRQAIASSAIHVKYT